MTTKDRNDKWPAVRIGKDDNKMLIEIAKEERLYKSQILGQLVRKRYAEMNKTGALTA